jgi:predicted ArsR family transcriptional regulator
VDSCDVRARKPQVYVGQAAILAWMKQEKLIATLPEIAQHFEISEASARRKADGLVAQGKLIVEDGGRGRHGWFRRYGINLDAE